MGTAVVRVEPGRHFQLRVNWERYRGPGSESSGPSAGFPQHPAFSIISNLLPFFFFPVRKVSLEISHQPKEGDFHFFSISSFAKDRN